MTRHKMSTAIAVVLLLGAAAAACTDDASSGRALDPLVAQPTTPTPVAGSVPVAPPPDAAPGTTDLATMTPGSMTPGTADPNAGTQPADGMTPGMAGLEDDLAGQAGTGGGGDMAATGLCRPADSVEEDGPFTPTHTEDGQGGSWVFYPEELGADGMLHPIFVWGPGAGTGPSNYADHLNRLASHGFVVISQPSSGSGTAETAELDWLLAENDMPGSTFYQKLDPERVGMGGHSKGSLTTMAMADDPRLSMYVLVCGGCMSASGGCGSANIHGPTVILGGDGDIGTPNFESDYNEIPAPVVFLTKDATGHIDCARNNLAPWVAFMRWQFCGEEQWMADFFDGGAYCQTPWACKSKNFP